VDEAAYETRIIALFRSKALVMSVEEAEDLVKTLTQKLSEHRSTKSIQPPKVVNGYLTREAIYEFFSQLYPKTSSLQQHAGRLHGRLLRGVLLGTLALEARCQSCHGDIQAQSCLTPKSNSSHGYEQERRLMEVSTSDLRIITLKEFTHATKAVGPATSEDFELLRSYL